MIASASLKLVPGVASGHGPVAWIPRRDCLGLIEAVEHLELAPLVYQGFRGVIASASLKP